MYNDYFYITPWIQIELLQENTIYIYTIIISVSYQSIFLKIYKYLFIFTIMYIINKTINIFHIIITKQKEQQ